MKKIFFNDFKIRFANSATKFYYNGQYVVAELSGMVETPSFSNGGYPVPMFMDNFWFTVKGVARPMVGDTYDEELGKKIALAKAENKAYDYAMKRIMRKMEAALMFNEAVLRFKDKVESVKEHNNEYIQRIS